MRREAALLLVLVFIAIDLGPLATSISVDPGDETGTDVIGLPAVTWRGTVYVNRSFVVPAGGMLTIANATVIWGTNETIHFGMTVAPGGKVIVRDSVMRNGMNGTDLARAAGYWNMETFGVMDIQRSVIRHASDLCFMADGTASSIIKDTEVAWTSRGIHLVRSNISGHSVALTLDHVNIHDMPNFGGGCQDIGGAIGILGSNAEIRNVTVTRALGTGLFVDRSTVAQDTAVDGDAVHVQDLLVVSGAPDGAFVQAKLAEIRTEGLFTCDRCAFVSPHGSGLVFLDDGKIVMRQTTIADARLVSVLQRSSADVLLDGVQMLGASSLVYDITTQAYPVLKNVSLEPGTARGATNRWPLDDKIAPLHGIWWGDASGPLDVESTDASIPATNPGLGRGILGPFDYSGWATAPPPDFHAIRLGVASHPALIAAGTTLSVPVTVANTDSRERVIDLSISSVVGATVSPASMTLAAGETRTATVQLPAATGVAPGVLVSADLVARSEGEPSIGVVSSTVAPDHPFVAIDSPRPYDAVSGAVAVAGHLLEPIPGTASVPASTSSGLGPMDANGNRVDDRLEAAPGMADVLITHAGTDESGLRADILARGGFVLRAFDIVPILWARVDAAQLPDLAQAHGIRGVWRNDPMGEQLALNVRTLRARTSLEGVLSGGGPTGSTYAGVWRGNPHDGYQGVTGKGVLVAVVDSGVDATHNSIDDMDDNPLTSDPKIVGHISTVAVLATGNTNVIPNGLTVPGTHATMVAGTLAGTGAGFLGSPDAPLKVTTPEDLWLNAGAAPGAQILDVQAFQETTSPVHPGTGPVDVFPVDGVGLAIQGFQAVLDWNRVHVEQPVRIVTCSLGIASFSPDHPLNDVANALVDSGVVVIVASGNNEEGVDVPASASKVLAVGAVDAQHTIARGDDFHARFSNVVNAEQTAAGIRKPEVVAPGVDIVMPALGTGDGYTIPESGTSFATPLTSAVAALILEVNPRLSAPQVKEIIIRSSEPRAGSDGTRYTDVNLDGTNDIENGGWTRDWGFGYVDAEEAVRLARETTPRAPPVAPLVTLFADHGALAESEPASTGVAPSPATFSGPAARALTLGDEDPTTTDAATVRIDAPSADPDVAVSQGVATLTVGGVTVAQTAFNDPVVGLGTGQHEIAVPLLLGSVMHYNTTGVEADRYNVTATLPVLDAKGDLIVPQGATIAVTVSLKHLNNAPAPIVTGPGGTRLVLPLDPSTLPDGIAPSAVSGVQVTWDATSAHVAWGPASDNVAIGGYTIVRDGLPIANVPRSAYSYDDATLVPGSQHTYTVRAVDLHGLAGPDVPPVGIVAPPLVGRAVIADFAGTSALASDDSGAGTFDAWHATLLPIPPGRHTLRASLFIDGRLVNAATEELTLAAGANAAPKIDISPIDGILHGARSIAFTASDPNGASDIASVMARVDDGAWFPAGESAISLSAAGLADGAHTLRVKVSDMSGATAEASAPFTAASWPANLHVPDVVLDAQAQAVSVDLSGTGVSDAHPQLVTSGVASLSLPLSFDGVSWTATLPPLSSGSLHLAVMEGGDLLGERTVVVDRPPVAVALAPATATRLDTVTLRDASHDDEGISARLWTLPDGTTSNAPTVTLTPFSLPVGDAVIRLAVTNVHGLTSTTQSTVRVLDLAPTLRAGAFKLGNLTVDHALTGEPISMSLDAGDPEGDALVITGGLGDALATSGAQILTTRPTVPGTLGLEVTASDPWLSTRLTRALPVLANQPPVAVLDAPSIVRAGIPATFDTRASRDPDRFLVDRTLTVAGMESHAPVTDLTLPLGVWPTVLTVTDTSGAATTITRNVTADDWVALGQSVTFLAPTLTHEGFTRLVARWSDGAPASNATVNVTVAYVQGGHDVTLRTLGVRLDSAGRGILIIPTDTPFGNLPGAHVVRAVVHADARPIAPIAGDKSDELDLAYVV